MFNPAVLILSPGEAKGRLEGVWPPCPLRHLLEREPLGCRHRDLVRVAFLLGWTQSRVSKTRTNPTGATSPYNCSMICVSRASHLLNCSCVGRCIPSLNGLRVGVRWTVYWFPSHGLVSFLFINWAFFITPQPSLCQNSLTPCGLCQRFLALLLTTQPALCNTPWVHSPSWI